MIHEGGAALDSGCFNRRDRHNAPSPDSQTLAWYGSLKDV